MDTLLQILGVLCLIAIAILLVPVAWLAYKLWQIRQAFRHFIAKVGELEGFLVPPMRVKLKGTSDPSWEDADEVEALAAPLRTAGFAEIGAFEIEQWPDVTLLALMHRGNAAYAAVYEHPELGTWLDLVSEYADGRIVTYTTSRKAGQLELPPFKLSRSLPDAEAGELLAAFLDERPRGERLPVDAASFVERFEAAWAREMDWRIARGGVTEDEVRRLAGKDGQQPDVSAIAKIRQQWQYEINAFYQERLQDAFLASGQVSAREWERVRDRTLFIHDQLTWEQVTEIAAMGFGIDPDDQHDRASSRWQEAERLAAGFAPREAFRRINEQLPASRRYQRLGETSEPIAADVYATPEFDREGDELRETD
jgi:hypothetical protein